MKSAVSIAMTLFVSMVCGSPRSAVAAEPPTEPLAEPPAPAPSSRATPLSRPDAGRLENAIRFKEDRRLEEALRLLEEISMECGAGAPGAPGLGDPMGQDRIPERGGSPKDERRPTAAGILAECEAIDTRLRLGRPEGLESRLQRLQDAWGSNGDVRRRVRALAGFLPLRSGTLLEPNAIVQERQDLGTEFRKRYFPGLPDREIRIPLDLPLRHLCNLSATSGRKAKDSRPPGLCVAGFLGLEEFAGERGEVLRREISRAAQDPRVLLVLFIFTGDSEPPSARIDDDPWKQAIVFWIRGTPESLSSTPVRSRYEWLPGPVLFIMDRGARIRGWRWPWESWKGFFSDLDAALAVLQSPAAESIHEKE